MTKDEKKQQQLHVLVDATVVAEIDRVAEVMSNERPLLPAITRADVVRVALAEWLTARKAK